MDLLDTSGPGAMVKPLGLFFPLALLLGAAGLAWPVAHIADLGRLAVTVNVLLVLGLVPLAGPIGPSRYRPAGTPREEPCPVTSRVG